MNMTKLGILFIVCLLVFCFIEFKWGVVGVGLAWLLMSYFNFSQESVGFLLAKQGSNIGLSCLVAAIQTASVSGIIYCAIESKMAKKIKTIGLSALSILLLFDLAYFMMLLVVLVLFGMFIR